MSGDLPQGGRGFAFRGFAGRLGAMMLANDKPYVVMGLLDYDSIA